MNDLVALVIARVTPGCQHHAHCSTRVEGDVAAGKITSQCGFAQVDEVGLQAQHDRLGFRVAEAAVEFDDARCAFTVDHQAGVEEAHIGVALGGHATHGRHDDFAHHALMNLGRDHGCR